VEDRRPFLAELATTSDWDALTAAIWRILDRDRDRIAYGRSLLTMTFNRSRGADRGLLTPIKAV
jgi:hypothetical protein